jgi:hypothetical protein
MSRGPLYYTRESTAGAIVPPWFSIMSFSLLPVELLSGIIRMVVCREDLCQLRSVNSTFNELATPALFENITVSNNYTSADKLCAVLRTRHIAQHLRSLTYAESRHPVTACVDGDPVDDTDRTVYSQKRS